MSLSDKQVQNVCMMHGGSKQCRFLEVAGWKDCHCLKMTGQATAINKKANEVASKMKSAGQDPDLHGVPLSSGGSCQGYPYLKTLKQGYDVKKK